MLLLESRITKTSKKKIFEPVLTPYVKLRMYRVSSTYLAQHFNLPIRVGIRDLTNFTINMLAKTGPNGEPLATRSLRCKCSNTEFSLVPIFPYLD